MRQQQIFNHRFLTKFALVYRAIKYCQLLNLSISYNKYSTKDLFMDKEVRKSQRTSQQAGIREPYISGVWADLFKHDILETRLVYWVNFAGGISDTEIVLLDSRSAFPSRIVDFLEMPCRFSLTVKSANELCESNRWPLQLL